MSTTNAKKSRSEDKADKEDKYIVFVSGIELGDSDAKLDAANLHKLQLFVDFLCGDFLSIDSEQESDYERHVRHMLMHTQRLIVAGNTLSAHTQSKDMHNKAKYLTKNFVAGSCASIKKFDALVTQLIAKLEVCWAVFFFLFVFLSNIIRFVGLNTIHRKYKQSQFRGNIFLSFSFFFWQKKLKKKAENVFIFCFLFSI